MLLRLMLLGLLVAAGASAAEPPVSPEAKRHVDVGVEHYNAGRYADAAREFELAYRLSSRPALLFNIARAEAKLGHEENAIAFLRRYLEERPNAPDAPAVMAEIEAHEKTLAMNQAKIQAESNAAQAEKEAARAEIEAAKAQRDAQEASEAQRQAQSKPVVTDDGRRQAVRRAGIGLTVAGALVLVSGIALGVVASQTADEVHGKSGEFADCCKDLEARGQLTESLGIAFDVVGGVAAAVGVGLLVWSARMPKATSSARLWITPRPGGISLAGSFQ